MSVFEFPKIEEKILKFWKDRNIFEKSVENRRSAGRRRFVFFEGPPGANGNPGIHHVLGRMIKDLFVRYKTMRGYVVERRAGWDTHGLPVEIETEKELGLKNKKEIETYGIKEFNKKAKQVVWKYKQEWEEITRRIGYWLDTQNPYITYDWKFIESLWNIISRIDERKLLYRGHKVLPWCPRCGTALSSHEVAQGYEDVTDTSVYVKFRLKPGQKMGKNSVGDDTYILAWTTTPWTLPGNVALAVGKSIKYQVVSTADKNEIYILAEDLIGKVLDTDYSLLASITGKELVGLEYEPLFEVPALQSDKSYKIYPADFVTTEDGTGIVHTAVMYGEDDYELGKKIGLPTEHTVDTEGKFNKNVKNLEGQPAKVSEKLIIEYLNSKGLLLKAEQYTHSYPHCWRCKNPLIYYAKSSWFIAMSKLRKQLVRNNNKINWVPDHLKHGRFGEFIKEAKDWALSRERYWGTPLPIWECDKCENYKVINSLEELEKYRYKKPNTFYIMRHGWSTKNGHEESIAITSSKLAHDKYDLTPEGVEQVEKAADMLAKSGGIDLIISSPFLRTRSSAEIIGKKFGVTVQIDERLKELDHGSACEGQTHMVCVPTGTVLNFETKYGDGESWQDVKKRMVSILLELDSKYEDKKILLVSHGDPIWILEGFTKNWSDEEMMKNRDAFYPVQGLYKKLGLKNFPYNDDAELDIHRPYVDNIKLACDKCKSGMTRVKDVADVWFDSGCMPYAQWHYPFEDTSIFKNNYPADFISEGIDQTRGWFYTLLAVSTALGENVPYKNVVSYSLVLDEKGKKMSKSLGNAVSPREILDKFGADATRWYFFTVNNPSDDKLFNPLDIGKRLNGFINTLLNSLRFYELYGVPGEKKPKAKPQSIIDFWLLSRLNSLSIIAAKSLDKYDLTSAARYIEKFVIEDLSNWWIRRSRERFQRPRNKKELVATVEFLRFVLVETSKLIAPFTPFLADHIYKKLSNHTESVHLEDWPKMKTKLINTELENQMSELREFVAEGLALRKNKNLKVRQPLASATLKKNTVFEKELTQLLIDELNVKRVLYNADQVESTTIDEALTLDLIMEGTAREIVRSIQDMRKESGCRVDDRVYCYWESDSQEVADTISRFSDYIISGASLEKLEKGHNTSQSFKLEKEFELAPQAKIWLGIRK